MMPKIFDLIDKLDECLSMLTRIYYVLVKLLQVTEQSSQTHTELSTTHRGSTVWISQNTSDPEEVYYDESELMTVKEAMAELRVSRWKISEMRNSGELTTITRAGRVRLIRDEVMAAKLWYSGMKGKI